MRQQGGRLAGSETALVIAGFLLFSIFQIHHPLGDDIFRFEALTSWMETGVVPTLKFSMIGPLLGAPLYLLGKIWATPEWWWTRFGCGLFVAVFGFLAFRVTLPGTPALMRRFVALVMTASMVPHALIGNSAELLTTVLVGAGLLALALGRPALGWAAVLLAAANVPATAVAVGLVALAHSYRTRRLRYLAAPLIMVAAVMLENWFRRGSPLATGYENDHIVRGLLPYSGLAPFGYPFGFGLLSIFLSFGKGLVFFAPGLLLGATAWRRAQAGATRDYLGYLLLFLGGLILVYAKWCGWYGGWTWGPRFFLFASLPASLILALCLEVRGSAAALAALSLSCWVGLSGVIYSYEGLQICTANGYALEHLCWYVPEFSVLWRPLMSNKLFSPEHWIWFAYFGAGWLAFAAPSLSFIKEGFEARWSSAGEMTRRFVREARW